MKVGKQIRAHSVRVIGPDGKQLGIMMRDEALKRAEELSLSLVEVVSDTEPPVCKIMDYGRFQYDRTRRQKVSKKSHHQVKLKEIKLKPNIDEHDFDVKAKRARQFIDKGNKVKVTCMFRGRELAHPEIGRQVVQRFVDLLEDCASLDAPLKMAGRSLTTVLSPSSRRQKQ